MEKFRFGYDNVRDHLEHQAWGALLVAPLLKASGHITTDLLSGEFIGLYDYLLVCVLMCSKWLLRPSPVSRFSLILILCIWMNIFLWGTCRGIRLIPHSLICIRPVRLSARSWPHTTHHFAPCQGEGLAQRRVYSNGCEVGLLFCSQWCEKSKLLRSQKHILFWWILINLGFLLLLNHYPQMGSWGSQIKSCLESPK